MGSTDSIFKHTVPNHLAESPKGQELCISPKGSETLAKLYCSGNEALIIFKCLWPTLMFIANLVSKILIQSHILSAIQCSFEKPLLIWSALGRKWKSDFGGNRTPLLSHTRITWLLSQERVFPVHCHTDVKIKYVSQSKESTGKHRKICTRNWFSRPTGSPVFCSGSSSSISTHVSWGVSYFWTDQTGTVTVGILFIWFWGRASLCRSGSPETPFVDQASHRLTETHLLGMRHQQLRFLMPFKNWRGRRDAKPFW